MSRRLALTVALAALVVAGLSLLRLLTSQTASAPPARLADAISFRETVGGWTLRGSLSPRPQGGLNLEMSLHDAEGNSPPAPIEAQIVMEMPDHPMPPVEVRATSIGPGSYRVAILLPMAGRWEMSIKLPVGVARVPLQALGAASTVPGASLFNLTNPIQPTSASVAAGEAIYRARCQECHGVVGAGDGPAGATLNPRPADLRIHMAAGHTDGQLFYWITEGFKGTAMPAFKGLLSEEERWHAINFIRSFAMTDR